ncbi:30S ribosomal protein S20 [Candidatus Woesebacteria bacterium]|nr:MAG: 30S ribosomal protein S20 [Candidatus Woesebacteria bacterium]
MPVTVTAKRALRGSKRKEAVNKKRMTLLSIALRKAVKSPNDKTLKTAVSLLDRANKNKLIHKNKVARIKSRLSKLGKKPKSSPQKNSPKKSK